MTMRVQTVERKANENEWTESRKFMRLYYFTLNKAGTP